MQNEYRNFFKSAKKAATTGGVPQRRRQVLPQASVKSGQRAKPKIEALPMQRTRRRKSAPWLIIAISCIGISLCGFALYEIDTVEEMLSSIELNFSFVPASLASEKAGSGAASKGGAPGDPAKAEPKAAGGVVKGDQPTAGSGETRVTSEVKITKEHLTSFHQRKQELDSREDELNRLEAELKRQQEELDKKLAEVQTIRGDISKMLEERVKTDGEKVETLVQVYSTMKPSQAAKVFEEMEEDLAIEILSKMKKKSAAEIMNLIKPEKLKIFSEKFAGFIGK